MPGLSFTKRWQVVIRPERRHPAPHVRRAEGTVSGTGPQLGLLEGEKED